MTPDEYYQAFVCGNYKDCKHHPGSVRRAFNAAVSASHFADHYWAYWKRHSPSKVRGFGTKDNFLGDLSTNTDGCFQDIRSISNAYKHLYTSKGQNKTVRSSISSTGAIESISLSDEDAGIKRLEEECSEDSRSNSNESRVIYTRRDGKRLEFLSTLDTVIRYWETMLHETPP